MAVVKIFGSLDPNVPNATTYSVYRSGTDNTTTAYDGSVEKPAENIPIGEEINVEDANEYDVVFADGNGKAISKWIGYRTNAAQNFCGLAMLKQDGEPYEVRTFRGRKSAGGNGLARIQYVTAPPPAGTDPQVISILLEA